MALVAVEADRQEQLRRVLHRRRRLAQDLVIRRRRVGHRGPGAGQDGVDELIIRQVVGDRLPDPVAQGAGARLAQELSVDLQQVGPFVSPVLDKVGAADQLVDQLVALDLGVAVVGQEGADDFRLGRQAGQVEVDPPDELGVGTQAARLDLDLLELLGHEGIDVVIRRHVLPGEATAVAHDDERRGGVGAFVAGHDRALAAAQGRDQAVLVGARDLDVTALDKRLGAHVAGAAVAVLGVYGHLLLHTGQRQDRVLREDVNAGDARAVAVELHAAGDPAAEGLVIGVAGLDQHAALVGHAAGRLEQHQAAVRSGSVEPATAQVVGERLVIEERVVAAQRQAEAVLALLGAVTGPRVAAHLGQHRHDIADEADLVGRLLAADGDGQGESLAGQGQLELAAAVRDRTDEAGRGDLHQAGRPVHLDHAGHVNGFASAQAAGYDELAIGIRVLEADGGGEGFEPYQLGPGRQLFLRRRRSSEGQPQDEGHGSSEV